MNVASLSRDLYGFTIELRQLAYTMPGGHEGPLEDQNVLILNSERLARRAR